jgi:hypothetical protein
MALRFPSSVVNAFDAVQRNFEFLSGLFPLGAEEIEDGSIGTTELADDAVTAAKIANEQVGGTELADDVVGDWRTLFSVTARISAGKAAAFYAISEDGLLPNAGALGVAPFQMWPINAADHAIAGRTTKVRLRQSTIVNATAPTRNIRSHLYPVTPNGGGAAAITLTYGAALSSVTPTSEPLAANSEVVSDGTVASISGSGLYVPAIEIQ